MKHPDFKELLEKLRKGTATEEEKALLDGWFDSLDFGDGEDEWSGSEADRQLELIWDSISAHEPRIRRRAFIRSRWLKIAASVLIMLSVTFAVRQFSRESEESSYANEKRILPDGTIVWINQSNDFAYYEKGGARFARFTGEALFEVAKNPNSPFTISCNGVNVRVLGTSFMLKADSAKIELNVLTGKVNVTSAADTVGVDVEPNEKIIYTTAGVLERMPIRPADIKLITANSEYNMKFQGAAMKEVIASIGKKFDVRVVVRNGNLDRCHVSADFTDHSLEDTLSILADLLGMSYRIDGKQVELWGRGC